MSNPMSTSWTQRIKQLDLYRDIPKDLTEQTTTGALVSLIAGLFIVFLFGSELASFLSPQISHSMFVDHPTLPHHYSTSAHSYASTPDSYDLLTVNLNLTLPALPCAMAMLSLQDVMGGHVENIGGQMHKTRVDTVTLLPKLDASGTPLSGDQQMNVAEQQGEGCRFHGSLLVKKVPGNLHITAQSPSHNMPMVPQEHNVSHIFHHLYFGDDQALLSISTAVTSPLSNTARIAQPVHSVNAYGQSVTALPSYEYYLKLVPTQYESATSRIHSGYQYIAHSNSVAGRYRVNAIFLRYDVDAITVRFVKSGKSFSHFLVQLCAIVGGVFSVLGMINGALLSATKTFKNKIGKLG